MINIDPLTKAKGAPLFNDTFDTRIKAAIRMNAWKLMTGYPGIVLSFFSFFSKFDPYSAGTESE